ncbi:hypothetical protein F2Q69_00036714 [Brassica cretica]|uniref:Uncharacterized protein n=1 Tax=Brassica cretica TaxID=69181 RepID=A0A8S9SDX2_BRACR|nr:hypothetical protein F2Q69_00036714 [Brassica cretica]
MEEGRVVSSVLNSQVQSKITEAVDFVFGESSFWNPAAKAKTLLFEELKPFIGTKFQYKFLDVGCSKNVRDDLQYLEIWSFHPKEYDSRNGTQRNHHMIDKNTSCFLVRLSLSKHSLFRWTSPSKLLLSVCLVSHIKQRFEIASFWTGASHPATNWFCNIKGLSATFVQPIIPSVLMMCPRS